MALFSGLSEKLQDTFKRLKGKGKLSEADIDVAMREVRIALLEADVNFKVVKKFINKVKERAIGKEVLESLTPGQQVIKIVNDELVNLMGEKEANIAFSSKSPTVIMMVGLQGSGKTTSSAKLARTFKKKGRSPLLAACDIYRPAAIKQLEVLGEQLDIPVFSKGQENAVLIAKEAIEFAKNKGNDIVIIDTAGRLHIDEDLMTELDKIKENVVPSEILLVVDAMTGQDAVNVAETFDQKFGITGIILTKLDGDTRGGAALSIREVTGKPIKFVGIGEKLDALETFHPDRMASRILGMGDVMTFIEKAQENFDLNKAKEMEAKIRTQQFTLEDFLDQLQQMKSMGPIEDLLGMIPGMGKQLKNMQVDEKELVKTEAIIQSMTLNERAKPEIINASRKKRIALGSGTKVQDVNKLLKQFLEARKMMKQFSGAQSNKKVKKKSKGLFNLPMFK
ncbi:MAG: signal recognition particle [Desulfitibacter sp. BRH_c19]|nr:MAG: signal recognition particle [Desulfitibacter sp. BRH_c19]